MKRSLLGIFAIVLLFISCNTEDVSIFEEDAATRSSTAIADLKAKLVAPENGWLLRYRPESESGSYNVIMTFNENGNVNIKSDLGVEDGEYFNQTITYRIDNSLGLELIIENYSFFSYLFEQQQATFLAEFEFNYVNETESGDLVFNSKSDPAPKTILTFQQAQPSDLNLLGTTVTGNISKMTQGLPTFTSVLKLNYTQKDVALYMSLDDFRRTVQFNYISKSSTDQGGQKISFSTGYTFSGTSMVLDEPLTGSFSGSSISISSISFKDFSESETILCNDTVPLYNYTGTLSTNEPVVLESSIFDPEGALIDQSFDFYYADPRNIFGSDGASAQNEIEADIEGVLSMQLYFIQTNSGPLNALGFQIQNPTSSVTFALKEFDYTITGNTIQMNFAPEYTLFNDTTAAIDAAAMDKYLNYFTEGGSTYIYRYSETLYEFYNPCSGWNFVFFASTD